MNGKNAFRIWRRDRRNHKSPNSAQSESACAGALGVQLAGDAWYFGELHHKPTIGDALRPVEPEDIPRANRLMYTASVPDPGSLHRNGAFHLPSEWGGWILRAGSRYPAWGSGMPVRHGGDIYRNPVRHDFSINLNPLGMPEGVKRKLLKPWRTGRATRTRNVRLCGQRFPCFTRSRRSDSLLQRSGRSDLSAGAGR